MTFFCFLFIHFAAAAEYIDGRIRLVINEKIGRFSLHFMVDMASEEYQPLFMSGDPRTSFLSIMINNRNYKMGESPAFKTTLGGTPSNPALIFESSFLKVTEDFSFVRAGSSSLSNGVQITITLFNKGEKPVDAGIRFLIDTTLGEKNPPHFVTNARELNSETLITGTSSDRYWISRNSQLVLMGSIDGRNRPDSVHFANWKRLNDAPWKVSYMQGRNFNMPPHSIDDSAVAYYYEPALIPRGGSRTVAIILSGDVAGSFVQNVPAYSAGPRNVAANEGSRGSPSADISGIIRESTSTARNEGVSNSIRSDLITLRELAARLNDYISSGTAISDEDLDAIGLLLSRIRSKYDLP